MDYFLGIDVGSSKTHALIVEESGKCAGFGKSGAGNHQNVGYPGLTRVLCEAFAAACEMARIEPDAITSAGLGVAGYDFPSDRAGHLQAIASLGLSCPVEIVNDGWNGLYAGATRGIGVNVTAGSSNNCRGRNSAGKEGRIVGNGMAVGEYGGAYEIVARGLHLVNYAWIQRIPPTVLTQIYLDAVEAKDEADFLEGLSNGHYQLSHDLAIDIIQAAREGDSAACEVTHWAGAELGWLAVAVARQIDMADEEVEIVQSGSLFEAGEILTQPMQEVVLNHCPRATLIRLKGPPVVGAVVLGMERAGFDGYAVRNTMVRTAEDILG